MNIFIGHWILVIWVFNLWWLQIELAAIQLLKYTTFNFIKKNILKVPQKAEIESYQFIQYSCSNMKTLNPWDSEDM